MSVSLPPTPIRKESPEQRAASAAHFAEHWKRVEQRERWRANAKPRTPAQIERKREADRVRALKGRLTRLRALLKRAAATRTYARFAWVLDRNAGWQVCNETRVLTEKAVKRMEHFTTRAAGGCPFAAEFIADAEVIGWYEEAREPMPADYLATVETMNARATRRGSSPR